MSTPIYLANDKYSADLSQKYTVGDAIIYVTSADSGTGTGNTVCVFLRFVKD